MNKEKYRYVGITFKKDDEQDIQLIEWLEKNTPPRTSLTTFIKNLLDEAKNHGISN